MHYYIYKYICILVIQSKIWFERNVNAHCMVLQNRKLIASKRQYIYNYIL